VLEKLGEKFSGTKTEAGGEQPGSGGAVAPAELNAPVNRQGDD